MCVLLVFGGQLLGWVVGWLSHRGLLLPSSQPPLWLGRLFFVQLSRQQFPRAFPIWEQEMGPQHRPRHWLSLASLQEVTVVQLGSEDSLLIRLTGSGRGVKLMGCDESSLK